METVLKTFIYVSIGWIGFLIILVGFISKIKSFGRPPIAWPALLLAKFAAGISIGSMLWAAASGNTRHSLWSAVLFLVLLLGGTLVFSPALFRLGRSLRVGLPNEDTILVQSGIYRFSRNPIYLGIFCIMGASLVYVFSLVNLVAVITGVLLHHRIVIAEERFLAGKFAHYEAYRKRVRRYL